MRLALVFLLVAGALAAQPAGVEGIVVNKSTGQPLGDVHVRFITGNLGDGVGIDQVYGATSDRAGRFSFPDLKPGAYLVVLERTGFVQAAGRMPVALLALKPGQKLTDYKLEMTPRALLSGRVVDEYGDPVQGVFVQLRPAPPDPEPASLFGTLRSPTDDRGEFRIFTSPGRYYLQASPQSYYMSGPPEIRTDGTSGAPFAATYYPSATSTSGAGIVQAAPGQDVAGIEIRLTRAAGAAGRGSTIGGMVTGIPEGGRANVTLRSGDSPERLYGGRTTAAGPDGKFSYTGLQPAYYRVFAEYSSGKTRLRSQVVDFQLSGSDTSNLSLILAPGEELAGVLAVEGDKPPGAPAEKFSVYLDPADSSFGAAGGEAAGEVDKEGSFRISNLFAGRFRVRVEPLPEDAYIQSVALDGAAAVDSTLDLTRGVKGSRVKIAIGRNGGRISGRVLGRDGEPLISPLAIVMLWKDPKQASPEEIRISDNKYSAKALRPGKYRLLAVDAMEVMDLLGDASNEGDLMKAFQTAAEEIEIKEGDRIAKDLKVVAKESINVKPKP
jgi:hypothetical protein